MGLFYQPEPARSEGLARWATASLHVDHLNYLKFFLRGLLAGVPPAPPLRSLAGSSLLVPAGLRSRSGCAINRLST